MADRRFSRDRLSENDENHSSESQPPMIGSYRTNSFFELFNNQHCIKNDLTREASINRSEEDEESNLNDDLNLFDDLDDLGSEPRVSSLTIIDDDELSRSEEDEQDDKFEEATENEEKLNSIPISQRFRKQRSHSRTIHEDELNTSLRQYAKSMPVNIPNNWKPFNATGRKVTKHDDDDDLDWFSVKDNPENIAESIKALARSVRDDGYELFGDLPTRRLPTQPI